MLPTKPPRDEHGNIVPHDHPDILNTNTIVRGILPHHLVAAATPNKRRVSSMAFDKSSSPFEGMSCDLQELLTQDGRDPGEWILSNGAYAGGMTLSVEKVRTLNLQVGYDPLSEPTVNPYHCQVWSKNPNGVRNFPDGSKRKLLAAAVWLVKPDDIEEPRE